MPWRVDSGNGLAGFSLPVGGGDCPGTDCELHLCGSAYGVRVAYVLEDTYTPMQRKYDPKHPNADAEGYVTMPNVNVVDEMVNMISTSRSHQTNVEVMNTAKQLVMKVLTLGQ